MLQLAIYHYFLAFMKKIVIGNWKLNPKTLTEAVTLTLQLKDVLMDMDNVCYVGIAPSVLYLPKVQTFVPHSIKVGVQDIAYKTATVGAFTGDVSAAQVASCGASFTLIGHSERRQYHGETDEILTAKIRHAFAENLSVVFCIGESKMEYEQGETKAVLEKQLQILAQFAKDIPFVEGVPFPKLIIAYEPVWAIGTGLTPTFEEVESVHNFISNLLSIFEIPAPILYGGSVNDKNAATFANSAVIDGVLVGGASLQADNFGTIIRAFS